MSDPGRTLPGSHEARPWRLLVRLYRRDSLNRFRRAYTWVMGRKRAVQAVRELVKDGRPSTLSLFDLDPAGDNRELAALAATVVRQLSAATGQVRGRRHPPAPVIGQPAQIAVGPT